MKCGKPLRRRCNENKPDECCSGKCKRKRCSNCRCNKLRCNRNKQCCSENCVRRRCESSKNCLRTGKKCKKIANNVKSKRRKPGSKPPSGTSSGNNGKCCAGSSCINRKCQPIVDGCGEFNAPCTKKQDCCSKYCKLTAGGTRKCQNKNCKKTGPCQMNSDCCSNNCNDDKICGSEVESCIKEGRSGCQQGGTGAGQKGCCKDLKCEGGTCVHNGCIKEQQTCEKDQKCCTDLKCIQRKCKKPKQCIREKQPCKKPEARCCNRLTCHPKKQTCLKTEDANCAHERQTCGNRPKDKKCCSNLKCEKKKCQKRDPKKCAAKGEDCKSNGTGAEKCCSTSKQKLECKSGRCIAFKCKKKSDKCNSNDDCCKGLKCKGNRCNDNDTASCKGRPCRITCKCKGCRCMKRRCKIYCIQIKNI